VGLPEYLLLILGFAVALGGSLLLWRRVSPAAWPSQRPRHPLALVLLAVGVMLLGQPWGLFDTRVEEPVFFYWCVAAARVLAILVALWLVRAIAPDFLGLTRVPALLPLVWGLVTYLAVVPVLILLGDLRGTDVPVQEVVGELIGASLGFKCAVFAAIVLVTPLMEEIVYRGLLQGVMRRGGSGFAAIVVSTLVFAVVHPRELFVDIVLLGLVLGLVYDRTRNLWLSVAIHGTHNALVFFILVSL